MVHHEILETPTQPAGTGVFTFYGSSHIAAPPSAVWSVLCDFANYAAWNPYNPTLTTPSGTNEVKPGDIITLAYRPEPTGELLDVPCEILEVDDEAMRLCWRGKAMGIPIWLLRPEKVQRVTQTDDGCFYEVYETQGGPMAWIVKWQLGEKLSTYAKGMAEGLKVYVEGKSQQSQ